jgi:VanZ family protein
VKRSIIAFTPLFLWAAAVLAVGGLDLQIDAPLPSGSDKAAHFIMYGVGGVLAAWAGRYRGAVAGWLALLFVLLTGAADELHQATVPTRHGDVWDWAADAAGATFAYLVARIVLGRDRTG